MRPAVVAVAARPEAPSPAAGPPVPVAGRRPRGRRPPDADGPSHSGAGQPDSAPDRRHSARAGRAGARPGPRLAGRRSGQRRWQGRGTWSCIQDGVGTGSGQAEAFRPIRTEVGAWRTGTPVGPSWSSSFGKTMGGIGAGRPGNVSGLKCRRQDGRAGLISGEDIARHQGVGTGSEAAPGHRRFLSRR